MKLKQKKRRKKKAKNETFLLMDAVGKNCQQGNRVQSTACEGPF